MQTCWPTVAPPPPPSHKPFPPFSPGVHVANRDYFGLPLVLAALHALAAFLTNYSMSQVSGYPVTQDTNNRITNYPVTQYPISYPVAQHTITITLSPIHTYHPETGPNYQDIATPYQLPTTLLTITVIQCPINYPVAQHTITINLSPIHNYQLP